jgi:hypothetical protein
MALYSNAAIVRAILKMRLHGQLVENVFYLRTKNADIPDTEIAASARDDIWRLLNDEVSEELTCETISVQEIFPVARDPYELAVAEVGAQVGNAIPTSVAAVASMKTGFAGKSKRGRKYIAGLLMSNCENSVIDDARYASLQAVLNNINANFQASNALKNLTWGVLHTRAGGAPVPLAAESYTPVTSVILRRVLGTMRSRIPGHGD